MAGLGNYSESITSVAKNILSPYIRGVRAGTAEGSTIGDAVYAAFGTESNNAFAFGFGKHSRFSANYANTANELGENLVKEGDERRLHAGKVAAGIAGLGLGYRFLSGGGVYRDNSGNTDIAGIPFV